MRGNIEACFILIVLAIFIALAYQIVSTNPSRHYRQLESRVFAYLLLNHYTFNESLLLTYYELSDLAYLKVVEYPGGITVFEKGCLSNCFIMRFVFIRSSLNYTVFELGVRP